MPGIYSHQRFCDLASDEIARLAAVDGADPATPIPTCGPWTMADLVQHVGHILHLGHNGPKDQGDAAAPTVTVRAPPADLYLFLWAGDGPATPVSPSPATPPS